VTQSILLTAFSPWTAQQRSNSADDLLQLIKDFPSAEQRVFLRGLPVNLPVAQSLVTARMQQLRPSAIVLCGMAEFRLKLSVESRAVVGPDQRCTDVDLEALTVGLSMTEISHHAGRFVCNSLYYALLRYLQQQQSNCRCVFVHVPVLTEQNRSALVEDFQTILQRLIPPI
jgi:pyroglutamyl-peptidase